MFSNVCNFLGSNSHSNKHIIIIITGIISSQIVVIGWHFIIFIIYLLYLINVVREGQSASRPERQALCDRM